MYTTIEASIKDGKLVGSEMDSLPKNARVLITLLDVNTTRKRPTLGTRTSDEVKMKEDAFAPLSEKEMAEWGL